MYRIPRSSCHGIISSLTTTIFLKESSYAKDIAEKYGVTYDMLVSGS